jgi:hypothetical protein
MELYAIRVIPSTVMRIKDKGWFLEAALHVWGFHLVPLD